MTDIQFFRMDNLSVFVGIFAGVFTLLTVLYSFRFMQGRSGLVRYYLYIILTFLASLGAIFSNNLVLFIVFWGFLGLLLYLLVGFGQKKNTAYTAKKTFIIIGGTDALMLLGLGIIWQITGSFQMDSMNIALNSRVAVLAYLCLAAGAFAKAGAMPFHTWVPDAAEDGPTPVTAFLPASLDKLLGIYFLFRISLNIFQMNHGMNTFLMAVGSITIVAAVMMALIQHDMKRLLGYHAVSQVGYMVLGIGTGNPIGIAGGLFHMLNHAIYKSCLFFSGGAVEKKTGTTDLEKLGGLAKFMPITFITFLIASFSISGVPPFNGFASKWMVYQGVINTAGNGGRLWVVWLVAAMIGSALTLASFMKLVHAIFLGQLSGEIREKRNQIREAPLSMWGTSAVLSALCVVFGVFACQIPLRMFIFPATGGEAPFVGIWDSGLVTGLMILAIVAGFVIYLVSSAVRTRTAEPFIGGEILGRQPDIRVSGVDFYDTVREIGVLRGIYALAERKVFDIYEVGVKFTLGFNGMLRYIHNGILLTYLAWCLLGTGVMFYILLR